MIIKGSGVRKGSNNSSGKYMYCTWGTYIPCHHFFYRRYAWYWIQDNTKSSKCVCTYVYPILEYTFQSYVLFFCHQAWVWIKETEP